MLLVYSLSQTDGAGGANESAEVASHTFGSDNMGLSGLFVECDGLMSAVLTGDVAATAADTLFTVHLRIDYRFPVQV